MILGCLAAIALLAFFARVLMAVAREEERRADDRSGAEVQRLRLLALRERRQLESEFGPDHN